MNENIFDERQKLNQYKYGTHSFFIITCIIIVCTIIKYFYPHSITPVTEMSILLFIPLSYFSIATILTNSHCSFSSNKKLNSVILLDTIITFIFLLLFLFFNNAFANIVEYKFLSYYVSILLICIYCLIVDITYIIRLKIDKKICKNSV